jgi:uracil-DNA glycosylase
LIISDLLDNVKCFVEQEVELFGDDLVFERDPDRQENKLVENKIVNDWTSAESLDALNQNIHTCTKCSLASQRQRFVFGEGNKNADILLVGEAPDAEEDRLGRPFVGEACKLLDKILAAINLSRDEVFICNILKCRPPHNRDPLPEETTLCQPYLLKQIELIGPKYVLCLGRFAAQTLLKTTNSLGSLRGRFFKFGETQLLVTHHPAALLQNPEHKKATWEDVQMLQKNYLENKDKEN